MWASSKEPTCQCRRHKRQGFDPWVRNVLWEDTATGNPLQYSYLENPMDRRVWQARVHRVTKGWTRLKQLNMHELSSSSSSSSSSVFYSSNLKKFSQLTFVPAEQCLNSIAGIQVRHPLSHFNFITYLSLKSYDS